MDHYFKTDKISDRYDCEECKVKGPGLSKLFVSHLPNTLIVHLKRFSYFPRVEKINKNICFPLKGLKLNK
jgi:ubiquitin C-terminal hydrolase